MSKKGGWTRSSISGSLEPIHGGVGGGPLSPQLFSRRFSKAQPFVIQENSNEKQEYFSSGAARRQQSIASTSGGHAKTLSSIPGITATSNLIGLGLYRSPKSGTGLTVRASKRSKRILSGLLILLVFIVWKYGGDSSSSPSSSTSKDLSKSATFSYLPSPPSPAGLAAKAHFPLANLFSSKRSSAKRQAEEQARELASSPHGGHTFHPNGLLLVNPKGRHPIHVLIENAEKKWRALLKKQSKTLDEATQEYKRRYKRNPPKGWESW